MMGKEQDSLINELDKCSDNDLAKLLLSSNDQGCLSLIKGEIFRRYYEEFDKVIGWVLRQNEIPYEPNEEYYETVFTEIYERIFLSPLLENKIKQFDFSLDFEKWFLNLVRGEVSNWLKKVDTELKLSKLEILREKVAIGIGEDDERLEITNWTDDEEKEGYLSYMPNLADTHRVLLRLRFVGYTDLHPKDINYISKTTAQEENEIKDNIARLQKTLKSSKKYEQSKKIELRLFSLKLKSDNLEKKVFAIKKVLEGLGCLPEILEGTLDGGVSEYQSISKDSEIIHKLEKLRKLSIQYNNISWSRHNLPVADNLLEQKFEATAPNQVWVTDITYIPTGEGWLYLAGHKDIFTKEIVGYAMDGCMTKSLVSQSLFNAVKTKRPAAGLTHHSDRGSQYCSGE